MSSHLPQSLPREALRTRVTALLRRRWVQPRPPTNYRVPRGEVDRVAREVLDVCLARPFRIGALPPADEGAYLLGQVRHWVRRGRPVPVTLRYAPLKGLDAARARADWAEYFALTHLCRWHNKVCAAYPPGLRIGIVFDDATLPMANRAERGHLDAYTASLARLIEALGYESFIPAAVRRSAFAWLSRLTVSPIARLRAWLWERRPANREAIERMNAVARRGLVLSAGPTGGQHAGYLYRVYGEALRLGTHPIGAIFSGRGLIAMYRDGTQARTRPHGALHLATLGKDESTPPWHGTGALRDAGHGRLKPFVLTAGQRVTSREVAGLDVLPLEGFDRILVCRAQRRPAGQAVAAPPPDGGAGERRRLRILLTEGSSTSARQTLYALGRAGHVLEICDPQALGLGRFSRYVRAWHRCPPFAADPAGYLSFLEDRLRRGRYDVLFPVHDQVFLLARFRERLARHAGLAVPDFAAVEQVQSKAAFVRLLRELRLPHPPTELVAGLRGLERPWAYPLYLKLAYGTAGRGVWLVRSEGELARVKATLPALGVSADRPELLVQQPARGVLCVAQAVFRRGTLLAAHCYRSRAFGVGGSARARESVSHPIIAECLTRLGAHLAWHGALHLEYFHDPDSGMVSVIEVNPRIGETLNATLSGTNLCELLVQVSLERPVPRPRPSRPGVRTHSLLSGLLAAAEKGAGRAALVAELWRAWTRGGVYAGGQDELSRPGEDPASLLPVLAVTLQLLAAPGSAPGLIGRAVKNYALTEAAAHAIRTLSPLSPNVRPLSHGPVDGVAL